MTYFVFSSERLCLVYRNHHFVGQQWQITDNFIQFDLIGMLQDEFLSIFSTISSLTAHLYFKFKEPQTLHRICCPFPPINIKLPSLAWWFSNHYRTCQKDGTQIAPREYEQVLLRLHINPNRENVCIMLLLLLSHLELFSYGKICASEGSITWGMISLKHCRNTK